MEFQIKKELDETVNQRIIIIRGEAEIEKRLNIITSKDKMYSYYHSAYLKAYLNNEYLDDQNLQNVKERMSPMDSIVSANIIYYLLKNYNDIIFTETTQDNSNQKTAILYLPDEILEEQQQEMITLIPYFEKFSSIMIQASLKHNGIVPEAEEYETIRQNIGENIQNYLNNLVSKNKSQR